MDQLEHDLAVMLRHRAGHVVRRPDPAGPVVRRARRRRALTIAACLIAVLVAAGGVVASRSLLEERQVLPAFPTQNNGSIVAVGTSGLTRVNAAGTEASPFFADSANTSGVAPAWSADGKQLAFLANQPDAGSEYRPVLYVADADGTNLRELTACPRGRGDRISCGNGAVAWSPVGDRIALAGNGLSVVEVDSGERKRLPVGRFAMAPTWSPDGTRIAFERGGQLRVVHVNPDDPSSSPVTALAEGLNASSAEWSPDGTRLVASAEDGIYVMDADGSDRQRIVGQARGEGPGAASWSPDGTRVVYFTTPKVTGGFTAQVRIVDPDGSHDAAIHELPCCVSTWSPPKWSPDGRFIAVAVESIGHANRTGLFVLAADGSTATRVPVSGLLTEPTWQAIP